MSVEAPDPPSTWHNPTARERLEIIRSTSTVAIVGMSADPSRASYFVATYLLSSSCSFDEIWFVNPKGGEILGKPVYRSLAELPGVPDLVDVFRRADQLPSVAEEFVAIPGARVFWAQLGLNSRRGSRHRHRRRPHRCDEPLPQDRARPLPRRSAPSRVRHRPDLIETPTAPLTPARWDSVRHPNW